MKYAVYTLGCKVNQYETQALEAMLRQRGFEPAERDADVVIERPEIPPGHPAAAKPEPRRADGGVRVLFSVGAGGGVGPGGGYRVRQRG